MARLTVVTMLTHSTCTGVIGAVTPRISAVSMISASPMSVGRMYRMVLRRLSYTP